MRIGIFIIALCSVVFSGCKDRKQPEDGRKQTWKLVEVQRSNTQVKHLYSATIQGRQDIEIRPQVQGKVEKVCVSEGQRVHKGQTLFVIDPVPYRAALAQATAQVKAARAMLATAKLNYESRKRLFDERVVSEHDLQTAHNSLLDAEAGEALALAAEKSARNDLSYTMIQSPSDGIVGMLPLRQGALVGPDITQPLTTVSDNSEMYVYFSMDESQLLRLLRRYGSIDHAIRGMDSVSLVLSDGGMYERRGHIGSISGVINRSTGSVSLRADFPNPDRLLHSGATGNIQMVSLYENVMLIPQSSTVFLQDKTIVYKVVDGKAVATPITVNPSNNGREYIVEGGLNVGDVIIAEGAGMVREGMDIK
ncbi:efflux RND transporter periplasmic adaptor subunit [Parabacteroides johnsonii]|uniref:efflux RND transporter periplasmic adaptor subunit n=1 Tax=Parabacteroides johnsonii TaxID=387661 RepID=UPI00266C0272|nr:efflux RND transporter periplasmic adaptor subunit [Parabacteroides johnsonii]